MAKAISTLDWCIVRLGDDHNWWVAETSDPVRWDVDGLSIVDPRQLAHLIDLVDPLRDYVEHVDLLLVRRGGVQVPTRREWPLVAAGGLGWFTIYNLTLNASERRIDAGTAALVVQVGPILVALLATVVLGERLTRWGLLGMVVGFAGVAVIAESSSSQHGDLWGVALALVAAAGFAVGVLTQKRLLARLRALDLTFWYTVVGVAGQ